MKDYKSGSHAVWDCKYHLVWITKYRYPVLVGDVGLRARELLREISELNGPSGFEAPVGRYVAAQLAGIGEISRDDLGILRAPSPAVVVSVGVAPGERVGKGHRIATLEAMNPQYPRPSWNPKSFVIR